MCKEQIFFFVNCNQLYVLNLILLSIVQKENNKWKTKQKAEYKPLIDKHVEFSLQNKTFFFCVILLTASLDILLNEFYSFQKGVFPYPYCKQAYQKNIYILVASGDQWQTISTTKTMTASHVIDTCSTY